MQNGLQNCTLPVALRWLYDDAVPLYVCIQRSHPVTSVIWTVAKNQNRSKGQTLSSKRDTNIFKSNMLCSQEKLIYRYITCLLQLNSSKLGDLKQKTFTITISLDQEFKSILARWYWLGISHEIMVSKSAGTWLETGEGCPFLQWPYHMAINLTHFLSIFITLLWPKHQKKV